MNRTIALLALATSVAAYGQSPKPPTAAPVLDETLQLKLDNDTLKLIALQAQSREQQQQLQQAASEVDADMKTLGAEVEKKYPGYRYQFAQPKGMLVPAPKPVESAAPAKAAR